MGRSGIPARLFLSAGRQRSPRGSSCRGGDILCPRDSQGRQLLRKPSSPPSLSCLQTAQMGKSANPKASFHEELEWRHQTPVQNAVCRDGIKMLTLASGDSGIALTSLCKSGPQRLDIKRITLKPVGSSLHRVDLLPGPLRSR